MKDDDNDNGQMERVLSRMGWGALIGGASVFLIQTGYATMTGFTEERVNPYISGIPTMVTVLWTTFGAIVGSLCSLVSGKWKKENK